MTGAAMRTPDAAPGRVPLLYITPFVPDPKGIGSEQRAWRHLDALAARYDVVMVLTGIERPQGVVDRLDAPARLCRHVVVLEPPSRAPLAPNPRPGAAVLAELRRLWAGRESPDRETLGRLGEALGGFRPRIVFCFRVRAARFWLAAHEVIEAPGALTVVDVDDIDSRVVRRRRAHVGASLGHELNLRDRLKVLRLERGEAAVLRSFDLALFCSRADAELARAFRPRAAIEVLPNGVPLPVRVVRPAQDAVPDLLFVGFMRYGPNIDAVRFLHHEIMPILRSACGEPFTLSLVGMSPPAWMRDLGREPGIEVTGRVDSVEPYYRRAAIALCPIRYGGGTRIKILEAMSFGRPVVATTVGAEGIDAEPGRDILIADTPRAFAEACLGLLRDPALRESIGASGRALVERSYAEPVVAAHLHALLDRRLNGAGAATETSFDRRV